MSPDDGRSQAEFLKLTARYESPVVPADDGYALLEPLLNGTMPSGLPEYLEELGLETPEQQEQFDTLLLPALTEAMNKPAFVPTRSLKAGEELINYRGLRHLVQLTARRADQLWSEGKREQALELLSSPLSLAQAMRSRPQTVSSYLFETSYAESALSHVPKWLESAPKDPQLVARLTGMVSQSAPSYAQLAETVNVDFAQLFNSLETEAGRENLGIGQVEPETLKRWLEQLKLIHREAELLYSLERAVDPAAFTKAVVASATPIQGIVIDYPAVSTMQKHSFAKYKACELGLALLGPKSKEYRALSTEELAKEVFATDPDTAKAVLALVNVELKGESIRVLGKPGVFELIAPGVEPVFFEYQPGLEAR